MARIKVERDGTDIPGMAGGQTVAGYDPISSDRI